MNDMVTVVSFAYVHQSYVIRSKLESEGIICEIKNEHTLQVHHFLSNAVGGVQLQVQQADYERALEIVKDAGLEPDKIDTNPLLLRLLTFSDRLPFGRMYNPYTKILIIVGGLIMAIVIAALALLLYLQPTHPPAKNAAQIEQELRLTQHLFYDTLDQNSTLDSLCIKQPQEALSFIERQQTDGFASRALTHKKGMALYHLARFDLALLEFRSLASSKIQTDPAISYNIALCHSSLLELDSAAYYFNISLQDLDRPKIIRGKTSSPSIAIRNDFTYPHCQWKFHCFINLGNVYYSAQDLKYAIHYYGEALKGLDECMFFAPEAATEREYARRLIKLAFDEVT